MSAAEVAAILGKVGPSIFARNIRGALGPTQVNKDLTASVLEHPELFWFLNNGVTILCSHVEKTATATSERLRVKDAQIINGQQTTRSLFEVLSDSRRAATLRHANVLVRVIEVPPSGPATRSFEDFVSSVVQATNWQNKIEASDLRSNDSRQVTLQRELRVLGYEYLRKRERKRDVRRETRGLRARFITKFDLAQAVAGCEEDSLPLREGKEPLFTETYYHGTFPTDDPYFYLSRYVFTEAVRQELRGEGEKRSMRWPIVYFLWRELRSVIEPHADRFETEVSRGDSRGAVALRRLVRLVIGAMHRFYRKNRFVQREIVAVDDFFKRDRMHFRGRSISPYSAFVATWRSASSSRDRRSFERLHSALREALAERAS